VNVLELPLGGVAAGTAPAADWACGCFFRRSITFFDGRTDATTQVVWIQSRGLTFDLRILPGRPRLRGLDDLPRASVDELVLLAEAEGGLATSTFTVGSRALTGTMDWGCWVRAQIHDGWPEPGELCRAGDCLIEFAPSGAYVEDWRAQPSAPGRLLGLTLLTEIDVETGAVLHAGGGLVVAGDHVGLVRGRPSPLPSAPRLTDLVREHAADLDSLRRVFAFEASYATGAADGTYVVRASTLPFRENEALGLDGFSLEKDGVVVQRFLEQGRRRERRFRVETNEPFPATVATPAESSAERWLDAEASTLLRNAR
jgi:hypothetical protein